PNRKRGVDQRRWSCCICISVLRCGAGEKWGEAFWMIKDDTDENRRQASPGDFPDPCPRRGGGWSQSLPLAGNDHGRLFQGQAGGAVLAARRVHPDLLDLPASGI